MKSIKININLIFFFVILIVISCKKEERTIKDEPTNNLRNIEGFYLFKKEMSYDEVIKLLNDNNIKYKNINIANSDEIILANFYHHLLFIDKYKYFKNIKLIEGYKLNILNYNLNRFQICFFNEKIFYFYYQDNFELEYNQNIKAKENLIFRNKLKGNVNLLSSFSEGFNFKYGKPNRKVGNFDSDISPNKVDYSWNNSNSKGNQFYQSEVWFSKDSILQIGLENFFKKDTLNITPPIVQSQIVSEIKVLFNSNYAKMFENYVKKIDSLDEIKNQKVSRKRHDSIKQDKIRQFKKL